MSNLTATYLAAIAAVMSAEDIHNLDDAICGDHDQKISEYMISQGISAEVADEVVEHLGWRQMRSCHLDLS